MTASTLPQVRLGRLARLRVMGERARALLGQGWKATTEKNAPALSRLADYPLSIAGVGFFSAAGFYFNTGLGLIVSGAALFFIEHLIADE